MPAYLLQSCTSETYPPNANSVSLQWEKKKEQRLKKTIKTRIRNDIFPNTTNQTFYPNRS